MNSLKKYEGINAIEQLPVVWDKAVKSHILDKDGNKWIDFTSSIFVNNSGHGDKRIIKNIKQILNKPLLHSYYYPTEIKKRFLDKLLNMTPKNLNKAILLSAGTEATERAIKISKIYGQKSKIKKNLIIGWTGNYHGKTLNAQMISGQFKDHSWIENFDKNIVHLPFPYPWLKDNNTCPLCRQEFPSDEKEIEDQTTLEPIRPVLRPFNLMEIVNQALQDEEERILQQTILDSLNDSNQENNNDLKV